MIDYENEKLLSFSEAARWFAGLNGGKCTPSTVDRWTRIGVKGVLLEKVAIGSKVRTSMEACRRFIEARTLGVEKVERTEARQAADSKAAAEELEALGVK